MTRTSAVGEGHWAGPDQLLGRQRERAVIARSLRGAQEGHGTVLVAHGEPGSGKSALLDFAAEAAEDFRVVRTAGVEGEIELAFAAVQQLCSPILALAAALAQPQRSALEVALGLSTGDPPDPFLVGLAVLTLLSEVANEQPLLCLVDDAQWLDRASAGVLTFVARRLGAERIAIIFAVREPMDALSGFAEIRIGPLGHRDARSLLERALPARLDDRVLDRIVVETGGNPLALLELPRGLTPSQLAGGFGLPAALPLTDQIEASFVRQLAGMSRDARRLLLLAAADPTGDVGLEWRAAQLLGIGDPAATVAELSGLLRFDTGATFRHPLVRSAVYGVAELDDRRDVHRALAEATDPDIDPDRHAWHRAQASVAPDDDVAAELELSAERARARGGVAASAAFLERSASLTLDPVLRAARALAAARAKLQSGALDDALRLVASAEGDSLSDIEQAKAELLRGQIAFLATRSSDAAALLLTAAERFGPIDPLMARETYMEALTAAIFAGPLAGPDASPHEIAVAASAAPSSPKPRLPDLLLDGFVALFSGRYDAAVPILREATHFVHEVKVPRAEQLRWMWGATVSALYLWDDDEWERLSDLHLRLVREFGALGELPVALSHRGQLHVFEGELAMAATLQLALQEATEMTGSPIAPYHALGLAAMRGREVESKQYFDAARAEMTERGEGAGLTFIDWAESVQLNGLGKYAEALLAARRVVDHSELVSVNWTMPELVEAAVRVGSLELASETHRRLQERANASGTEWALGIAARSHALLAEGGEADDLYREAIERLARTRVATDRARAHLLYGEWLRRVRRRSDARNELRTAHELFSTFGMEAFAERARVELEATGERARKRAVDTLGELTPRESQISRLVIRGDTNTEIAAQLFISPSTVEYHLWKLYRKLGVKSRTQLAHKLQPTPELLR